jgi:hypothetical protein
MATFVKSHRRGGKMVRGYRRNSQTLGGRKLARDPRYGNYFALNPVGTHRIAAAVKHAYKMHQEHPTRASKKLLGKVIATAKRSGKEYIFNLGGSATAIATKGKKFRKFKFL